MMDTICIMCPMGCCLSIEEKDGQVVVKGNGCIRGKDYGVQEYTSPVRILTTIVKRDDGGVASVKTSAPIPKDMVLQASQYVGKIRVSADCKIGDIVEENFFQDGVNLVITGRA